MRHRSLVLTVALAGVAMSSAANAAWNLGGNSVCPAAAQEYEPSIVSDGVGGAIIAWHDNRNGNFDIHAARVDPTGITGWCVGVCVAIGDQGNPVIVSDGAGGAIVAWEDGRDGVNVNLFAQRIDSKGTSMWTANGVAVCVTSGERRHPAIVSDGAGGVVIAWDDTRNGNLDIYCARFNYEGKREWMLNGVALCTAINKQAAPSIASDGAGGAIVTWADSRLGTLQIDVYARRVNASGTAQWTADGVGVCTAGGPQDSPVIVADDGGGAIIAWQDRRTFNDDIYAQRINSSGASYWTANGVALCTALFDQGFPAIVSDGAYGAIVSWWDRRAGNYDIYVRRVNAVGTPLWTSDGVALCTAAQDQVEPAMTTDGVGGAIVAWRDGRNGTADIYAHHVDALGNAMWMQHGSEVCIMNQEQLTPVITSGAAGDAIIAWADQRSGIGQTYAQRMSAAGSWGNPEPVITSVVDTPGDQGGSVTLRWTDHDRPGEDYLYEILRNDSGFWTSVAWVPDNGGGPYSLNVATLIDSTCWSSFGHQFKVQGYISSIEASNVVTARSVDNIAPSAPVLTGQFNSGQVTLHWIPGSEPDIDSWTVYLSAAPGHVGELYFSTSYDTTFTVDFSPPFVDQYWSVRAWDVHCNPGAISNEVVFLFPNTPPGANVHVEPYDEGGSGSQVGVTFANVSAEGRTTLNVVPSGPALPGTFTAGDNKYYNITTTATTSGNIEVCIQYDEGALSVPEANLRMLHYDTAQATWEDITTYLNVLSNAICGVTDHLSPFVLGSWGVTAVGDDRGLEFALHENIPNPFNPITTVRFDVPRGGADVNITIYDVSGRKVRELVSGRRPAGRWSLQWNGEDDRGRRVASGVYFYRMRAGEFMDTKKMVLLK